jgi:cytoskeletal protein RodZ
MYEDNGWATWRRILWYVLWLLVVIAVVWVVVWALFFRQSGNKSTGDHQASTSQNQTHKPSKSGNSSNKGSSSNAPSGGGTTSGGDNQTAGTPSPEGAPDTLVNTGPGAIVAPVVTAAALGGVWYEIRLHRRAARA